MHGLNIEDFFFHFFSWVSFTQNIDRFINLTYKNLTLNIIYHKYKKKSFFVVIFWFTLLLLIDFNQREMIACTISY